MLLADIVLPLALPGAFTYIVPPALQDISIGSRVVVPLGKSKRYAGIVTRLYNGEPTPGIQLKEIEDLVDKRPLLLQNQIDFWRWMAHYYMCLPGEVMKAALPSGLKLESETVFALNEAFSGSTEEFSEIGQRVFRCLGISKKSSAQLQKEIPARGVIAALRRLVEEHAIVVEEHISCAFRARTEKHVRLTAAHTDEATLHADLNDMKRSRRQEEVLLAYLELADAHAATSLRNPALLKEVSVQQLSRQAGGNISSIINALCKKGILETYDFEIGRLRSPKALSGKLRSPLSEAQQKAHREICQAFTTHDVCLLHGVTSSGKTEIYTRLIEETIGRGQQVLYLLPEIALTTQITSRLGQVFGNKMGIYHSKYPDAERVELWHKQLSDSAFPLILGVRSSVFLPFKNLGLVIVDEEHETSYKQQDPAPRYNARDAAIMLALQTGAKVLLGTATPSLETYHNAKSGKYGLVELFTRYGDVRLPRIIVEDIKELRRKKLMKSPFSPRLMEEVRRALSQGEQAILFQNRRGYAPVLECRSCGWTPHCSQCDVSLTFHQKANRLVCHYCGSSYAVPDKCPNCEDSELRDVGYGTEKVEAAAESHFENARIARMDLDTTRVRSAYERLIHDFQTGQTNLLIGTQMVTKGLDFDRVSVVGILNADQMLNIADVRAHERAFQMMAQVAGRAGRRGKQGTVVLQTRQPELPIVQQVVGNDYTAMYEEQMQERSLFRFPPAVRLINIYLKHREEAKVTTAALTLESLLRPHFGTDLLGPDKPAVGRIQLQYIRKFMLKTDQRFTPGSIRDTLLSARDIVTAQPGCKGCTIYFDVDPL